MSNKFTPSRFGFSDSLVNTVKGVMEKKEKLQSSTEKFNELNESPTGRIVGGVVGAGLGAVVPNPTGPIGGAIAGGIIGAGIGGDLLSKSVSHDDHIMPHKEAHDKKVASLKAWGWKEHGKDGVMNGYWPVDAYFSAKNHMGNKVPHWSEVKKLEGHKTTVMYKPASFLAGRTVAVKSVRYPKENLNEGRILNAIDRVGSAGTGAVGGAFIGAGLGAAAGGLTAGPKGAAVGAIVGSGVGAYKGAKVGWQAWKYEQNTHEANKAFVKKYPVGSTAKIHDDYEGAGEPIKIHKHLKDGKFIGSQGNSKLTHKFHRWDIEGYLSEYGS